MKLLPEAVFDQHVIVLGKTRSGKSSAMRLLVEHLLDKDKPVCIIDPKGDWWGLKASASGKQAGYSLVIFGGEHADVPLNSRSGGPVAELVATGNRSCIIDLGGWMPGDRTQFWIDFASTYFRAHRGRHYLVIDEVHNLCPKGKIMDPNAGKMLHWSNRLASEGLGKGISMIAASQRPQKVHNDFLTSCETLLGMRVIHKADCDAISDWIDGCADPEMAGEVLRTIASLKRGEAWAWSPEAEFGPKRIQFPMFKSYDSFKPQVGQPAKLKGWADVDLKEVTAKLSTVVKEAEANDPAKLKARIRELEMQMRAKPERSKEVKVVDQQAIDRAVRETYKKLGDSQMAMQNAVKRQWRALKEIAETAAKAASLEIPEVPNVKFTLRRNHADAIQHREKARPRQTQHVEAQRPAPVENNGDLTGPEKKILVALAQLRSIDKRTPPKEMVAGWAGYSPIGGAFGNPLGALRSKGLVQYPSPGVVQLTTEGLSKVGEQPVPDQEEMQTRILQVCSGPERKILAALLDHGAEEISKAELAERSGYSVIGGAFGNPLGALRTKGFLDYPRPGIVKVAEWLFL